METPHKGGYACGWECWREAGFAITSHEGAVDGFSAFFGRAPDGGLAVIVLLATDAFTGDRLSAAQIGEPLLKMALSDVALTPPRETPPAPLDATHAAAVAGTYTLERVIPAPAPEPLRAREVPAPPRVVLTFEGSRLVLAPDGEPTMRLFAAADGTYFPKQLGVRVIPDKEGRITLERFGRRMVYLR